MLTKSKEKLENGKGLTIVALGDSLTQGWMVRKGYIDFLNEMIPEKYPGASFQIIKKGVPGDTAEGALYRLRMDVLDHDPDLVFVQFAVNDAYMGVSPDRFQKNIEYIIDRVKEHNSAEILLVTSVSLGSQSENDMINRYYCRLEAVAGERSLGIVKVHEYWEKKISEGAQRRGLVQADGAHPTIEGYRLMAEAIMEVL